jgi:hypothetical protein
MQICHLNIKIIVFCPKNVSPKKNLMKNVSPTKKKRLRTTALDGKPIFFLIVVVAVHVVSENENANYSLRYFLISLHFLLNTM